MKKQMKKNKKLAHINMVLSIADSPYASGSELGNFTACVFLGALEVKSPSLFSGLTKTLGTKPI